MTGKTRLKIDRVFVFVGMGWGLVSLLLLTDAIIHDLAGDRRGMIEAFGYLLGWLFCGSVGLGFASFIVEMWEGRDG